MYLNTLTFYPPNPQDYIRGSNVTVIGESKNPNFQHTTIRVEAITYHGSVGGEILSHSPVVVYTRPKGDKK